jgi:hypothetical protein
MVSPVGIAILTLTTPRFSSSRKARLQTPRIASGTRISLMFVSSKISIARSDSFEATPNVTLWSPGRWKRHFDRRLTTESGIEMRLSRDSEKAFSPIFESSASRSKRDSSETLTRLKTTAVELLDVLRDVGVMRPTEKSKTSCQTILPTPTIKAVNGRTWSGNSF